MKKKLSNCKDQADTDDYVRGKAREVLSELEVYGGSDYVPPIEDIVDKLVENIKVRETTLKILAEIIE